MTEPRQTFTRDGSRLVPVEPVPAAAKPAPAPAPVQPPAADVKKETSNGN